MTNALIRAEELCAGLDKVKILDCSYGLPPSNDRIGNAVDFDIDAVAAPGAPLAHTLPSPEIFADHAGRMGISNNDAVVVYDRAGIHMAAARVWWMFRVFGHDNVRILDGGLPVWMKTGLPVSPRRTDMPKPAAFKASFRPHLFKQQKDMVGNLQDKKFNVLDARASERYSGAAAEPRPGMGSGHIPGSLNLPFMSLIDSTTGLFKQGAALEQAIAASGYSAEKPVAISCGSGVTACVVALGLYQTGNKDAAVYGGSWAEWGGDPSLPKTKGSAP